MKKILAILLLLFFTVSVSCARESSDNSGRGTVSQEPYSAEEMKEKCEDYIRCLTLVLNYEWNSDIAGEMYNNSNSMYFKAVLQSLYKYDYGTEMDCADGYIKIEDYVNICTKHFPVKAKEVQELIKASGIYDESTDRVTMTEGIGSVKLAQTENIVIDDNTVTVYYLIGDALYDKNSDKYVADNSKKGILTIETDENNNFIFVSNILS